MKRRDSEGLAARAAERRKRIVGNRAANHEEAERWDLQFWQSLTPQDRLSALTAIHRDVELVQRARAEYLRRLMRGR